MGVSKKSGGEALMPIPKHIRHLYRGAAYRETRQRMLARAKNRCERCRKPNGAAVFTFTGGGRMHWVAEGARVWRDERGKPSMKFKVIGLPRKIRCVLTMAHLNHQAGDDRPRNLRMLCQWCHLHYDRQHHHETRATRKDAERPLLRELCS
jgi:hypothetical protein